MTLSSLSELHSSSDILFGRSLLLPVDNQFVQAVHPSPPWKCGDKTLATNPNNQNGDAFLCEWSALCDRARNRGDDARSHAGVPSLVFTYAAESVLGSRSGEFMGPLCSPIRKSHASMLRHAQYFVTEKSDGIRVVVVSLLSPVIPHWEVCGRGVGIPTPLPLNDVVQLEEIRQRRLGGSDAQEEIQVRLTCGVFALSCTDSGDDSGDIYTICQKDDASVKATPYGLTVRRIVKARHMTYCFDRSMNQAYLLLDEYTSPELCSFAVDGELMLVNDNEQEGVGTKIRLILGCFDAFRYTELKDGIPSDVRMTRWPMSKRYDTLKNLIIKPMEASWTFISCEYPLLRFFSKDMVPLEKFADCASRVTRKESNGNFCSLGFYYKGPFGSTRCDGFIFTPERFDLVHGASKEQLKWKWPSMLSVDWAIMAVNGVQDEYIVDMFFRKRRFGHRPDSVGRTRLSSGMRLLNPLCFPISNISSIVAECVYKRHERAWCIERLRGDKSEPNSVVTVISVLESLVEDINFDTLVNMISQGEALSSDIINRLRDSNVGSIDREASQENYSALENKVCQFTLRATQLQTQGEHELHLYWAVRLHHEKQLIPCIHCKISECRGFDYASQVEDNTSKLTEQLYIALANAGGSYAWSDFTVGACFDGEAGIWQIVSMYPRGNNKKSTCVGVIDHLQWLLTAERSQIQNILKQHQQMNRFTPEKMNFNSFVNKTNAHYATKARELSLGKERSALRRFNNWIKSVLISHSVDYVRQHSSAKDSLVVADLCAGRGGDLFKWRAIKPKAILVSDSCLEAVAEAAARYCISKGLSEKMTKQDTLYPGIPAHFCVCDAFEEGGPLLKELQEFCVKHAPNSGLSVVSCQFSIHYGCSSEERASAFLRAISLSLRPGGVFIGTTVSDEVLLSRFGERGADFGNGVYNVKFSDNAREANGFGLEYFVSFENSVSELSEYVVPWERFVELCKSFKLEIMESFGFLEYCDMHFDSPLGQELRDLVWGDAPNKRDASGHAVLSLSPEAREAAELFRVFFFIKSG